MTQAQSSGTQRDTKLPSGFELVDADTKTVTRVITEYVTRVSVISPKGQRLTVTATHPHQRDSLQAAVDRAVAMAAEEHESPVTAEMEARIERALRDAEGET